MKRCIKMISAIVLVLVVISTLAIGAFAAEDCDHEWTYESGYVDVTRNCLSIITYKCSLCSATKTEEGVNSHKSSGSYKYVDEDTCMAFCKECSSWYELPGHVWNAGVITKSATCSNNGAKTYTCIFCNGTKNEVILATGDHEYGNGYWGSGLCPDGGFIYYDCLYCDYIKKVEADPVSHYMTNGVCERCGYSENESGSDDTSSDLPETTPSTVVKDHEHDFSSWKKTSEEKHMRQCLDSDCGLKQIQNHQDLNFDNKCDDCGSEYSSEVSLEKVFGLTFGAVLVFGIAFLAVNLFKKRKD